MTVKLALLGAGRIGQVHAKAVGSNSDATLVAVADAFEDAAQKIAQQYGCEVQTIDQILERKDIDAVIICTPTNTHADLIEQFSIAGKAIFCEKPIDLNLARVAKCLETVKDTNAKLMLGFNRRFDPHFGKVKQAIDDGTIGTVEQVVITSRDPGLPPAVYIKVSGGMFRDMTIHDFDMARFLLGEEIDTVYAVAGTLVDPKVEELGDFDTATLILKTATGKQCSIMNSRRATYGYDQRIEVHGSKGMAYAENPKTETVVIANGEGYRSPPLHDFFMTRYLDAYALEIAAFVSIIRDNSEITPSGDDGYMALVLAEAALKSIAEGRAVSVKEITA